MQPVPRGCPEIGEMALVTKRFRYCRARPELLHRCKKPTNVPDSIVFGHRHATFVSIK